MDISDNASKEYTIEKRLEAIRQIWSDLTFDTVLHRVNVYKLKYERQREDRQARRVSLVLPSQSSRQDRPVRGRTFNSDLEHERHPAFESIPERNRLLGEIHCANLRALRQSLGRATAVVVHGRSVRFRRCSTAVVTRNGRVQIDQRRLARRDSSASSSRTERSTRGHEIQYAGKTRCRHAFCFVCSRLARSTAESVETPGKYSEENGRLSRNETIDLSALLLHIQ